MQAKMTPAEVTKILTAKEFSHIMSSKGPVKYFDINTLDSNSPSEDSQAVGAISHKKGMLFGIFDGHGGDSCGMVVAKRLFDYVSAALLSPQQLENHLNDLRSEDKSNRQLVKRFNDKFELIQELKDIYSQSYTKYVEELKEKQRVLDSAQDFKQILIDSFNRLDKDMSDEATTMAKFPKYKVTNKPVTIAMSGCVAAAAYINGPHLTVAGAGDVTAVVGYLSETDTWMYHQLTNEHNGENVEEVKRIRSEHPDSEKDYILKGDRLLSCLAPLRAFGDFKFKWKGETVKEVFGCIMQEHEVVPPYYKTPPYLTARPDVMYHRLTPRDKFLVIGSDGLWEKLTPNQVVRLVGEYFKGKTVLQPLGNLPADSKLGDIRKILKARRNTMKTKPTDTNAATHLIRYALGGATYGLDHFKLSRSLRLPQDMVRLQRDDITIQVVFFDDEYLRKC